MFIVTKFTKNSSLSKISQYGERNFSKIVDTYKGIIETFSKNFNTEASIYTKDQFKKSFFKTLHGLLQTVTPVLTESNRRDINLMGLLPNQESSLMVRSGHRGDPGHLGVRLPSGQVIAVTKNYPPSKSLFYNREIPVRMTPVKVSDTFTPGLGSSNKAKAFVHGDSDWLIKHGFKLTTPLHPMSETVADMLGAGVVLRQMTVEAFQKADLRLNTVISEKSSQSKKSSKDFSSWSSESQDSNVEKVQSQLGKNNFHYSDNGGSDIETLDRIILPKKTYQEKVDELEMFEIAEGWADEFDKKLPTIQLREIKPSQRQGGGVLETHEESKENLDDRCTGSLLKNTTPYLSEYQRNFTFYDYSLLRVPPKPEIVKLQNDIKNADWLLNKNKFSDFFKMQKKQCVNCTYDLVNKFTSNKQYKDLIEKEFSGDVEKIKLISEQLRAVLKTKDHSALVELVSEKVTMTLLSDLMVNKNAQLSTISEDDLTIYISEKEEYLRQFLIKLIADCTFGTKAVESAPLSSEDLLTVYSNQTMPIIQSYDNLLNRYYELEALSETALDYCMLKCWIRITELLLKNNSINDLLDSIIYYTLNREDLLNSENLEYEVRELASELGLTSEYLQELPRRLQSVEVDETMFEKIWDDVC